MWHGFATGDRRPAFSWTQMPLCGDRLKPSARSGPPLQAGPYGIAARRCYGFTTNDERITIGDVMAEPLWINGKSFTAYGLVRRGRSLTSQTAFGGQLPYKGSLGRPVVNNGRYTQLVYEKWFCDL